MTKFVTRNRKVKSKKKGELKKISPRPRVGTLVRGLQEDRYYQLKALGLI